MTFEIKIYDKGGLWGSLKVNSTTLAHAKMKARREITRSVKANETSVDLKTLSFEPLTNKNL
jgi:hypothetical protein